MMKSTFSFRTLSGKKIALIIIAAIIVLASFWLWSRKNYSPAAFRFAAVTKGDLEVTVSATGTVEPEELVDVGAQVAGRIVAFGKDKNGKPIDYGSAVEAGMVLARIDDSLFAAEVSQARAQLAQSRANVQRAEADLGQLRAKLIQAESDWRRAEKLGPSEALSQSDFDAARSNYDVARANLKVGQAALRQTKEAVAQSEAVLKKANQNLDYCTIRSPVKGVIIDRRVNIGQTVVASLSAPSLFLIAKDLKRLQIWVAVNEADIGNIRVGQPVAFTVDAFPQDTFAGTVGKVRLNATMTQNVVTYTVEVITDNSDGKLMPYLTANVKFLLATRQGVLLVPNATLRWFPQPKQIAPAFRDQYVDEDGAGSKTGGMAAAKSQKLGTLWIPEGSYVRPVQVQVGLSDGSLTEIQGPEVKEGLQVIVAEEQQEGPPAGTSSPFTPKLFRDKRPSPRP